MVSSVSVRIRPGLDVALINLSAWGALVEGSVAFAPSRPLVLELRAGTTLVEVPGRVVRGFVAHLSERATTFRGAIGFERRIGLEQLVEAGRVVTTHLERLQTSGHRASRSNYTPNAEGTTSAEADASRIP